MKTLSAEKIEAITASLENKMVSLTGNGKIDLDSFLDKMMVLPEENREALLSHFKACIGNRKARMTLKSKVKSKVKAVKVRRGVGSY